MARHKKATNRRRVTVAAALGVAMLAIAGLAWAQEVREAEGDRQATTDLEAPSLAISRTPLKSAPEDSTRTSGPRPVGDEPTPSLSLTAAPAADALDATALRGRASGVPPGATLVVERQQADGTWEDFPLPTVVDAGGGFLTRVELGHPGRNRIRVRHAATGLVSNPVTITVRRHAR